MLFVQKRYFQVNMALSDSEERVRRAATVRIIKDVNLKALSIKQRMDLVQGVMNMSGKYLQ